MKLRIGLLTSILIAAMSVCTVFAGGNVTETPGDTAGGLLSSLFGEDSPLSYILNQGGEIEKMLDTAKSQLGQADQEIGEIGKVLDEIVEKAQDQNIDADSLKSYAKELLDRYLGSGEDVGEAEEELDRLLEKAESGELDADSLKSSIEEILGQLGGVLGGDEEDPFAALDVYFEEGAKLRAAQNDYIKARNAELTDSGDVQILTYDIYCQDDDFNAEEIRQLCFVIQNNYRMDDENQLRFVSSTEDAVLFRQYKDEDGNFPVKEASFAEDSDHYASFIEEGYREMGESIEENPYDLEHCKMWIPYDLNEYLNQHPDVKGIEYEGEIRTAEELEEIFNAKVDEYYGLSAEEELTEETDSAE